MKHATTTESLQVTVMKFAERNLQSSLVQWLIEEKENM